MPRYRVTFEIEADDSDGAFDAINCLPTMWSNEPSDIHVMLLDEPEEEE